jgi:alpha,alpha-trehalase
VTSKPISDYAMIGNCQSAALVARDGSIDWWCAPRFDSPAVFARILDESAGHFKVAPIGSFAVTRKYLERSMVLETTMETLSGTVVLTDALALGSKETGHEIGYASPAVVMRKMRCVAGSVTLEIEVAARPEYGLVTPLVDRCDGGAIVRGGADLFVLSLGSEPFDVAGGVVRSRVSLGAGEELCVALERVSPGASKPKPWREREIASRIDQTLNGWQTWSGLHQSYQGDYNANVHHGGRVLQALTYQPAGSVVAAPTTSLPELPGGALNWDYRYSWIRDASLTMNALWVAACPDEAYRYFSWLAYSAAGDVRNADLQIVFGIGGEHDLTERELPHLRGWRDSKPVRVGNDAWRQRQLDVYGEVAGAAFRFRDQFDSFDATTRTFVIDAIERAAEVWNQTDHGIWEIREKQQHFVHSKLMCWQALETGIALAAQLGVRDRVVRWARCRDEIDAAIRTRGWNEDKKAYTQAFESSKLDASALLMPISGFLGPDDPRARSTIEAVARELGENNLVRRYAGDGDGEIEGAFIICSFWLAHARAIVGDIDAARETFEQTVALANDVGLLAEEIDIASGEQLGNFPQAFSHVGLINAAAAIDTASKAQNR